VSIEFRNTVLPTSASVGLGAFPPVLDHGRYPTCAAAVITGLAAFHAHQVSGRIWRPSLLFNYATSRVVGNFARGVGTRLDWCLAAWRRFGITDEQRWPFDEAAIDRLPDARAFGAAKAYRGIGYRRIDGPHIAPEVCLHWIRKHLAGGAPVTVDYPLNPVQARAGTTALLPALAVGAEHHARHAVLAVSYHDDRPAGTDADTGAELRGALLVRNSWGSAWGEAGHAWLPYRYVLDGLTTHHWTVGMDHGGSV